MADLNDIVQILEQIRDETIPGLSESISGMTSATADAAEASRAAAKAAKESAEASEELSESLEETGKKAKEAKKHIGSYTMGLATMGKGIKKTVGGLGTIASGFVEVGQGALSAVKDIKANSDAIVGSIQTTRRATGMSKEMAFQIADTADALRIYGVTSENASAAVNTLYNSTSIYSQLSKEQQNNIANEAALMEQLGISMSTYASNIEFSMRVMGMSADEATDNMRQLRATAIDLNIPISKLTSDFSASADMLAKLGDNGISAFNELARVSKITGLEMNKLLGITEKFDTFEGAAEAAGSLNAALGGNFVDSMSLMMETDPAERFKMIRGAVEDAGLAFDDMGYYQKKMMADATGLGSVSDLAKAMSGDLDSLAENMGKTDSTVEAAMEEAAIVRTPEEMAANFAKALQPAAGAIAKTMVDASDEFGKKMLPTIQQLDASTKAMTDSVIEDFGFVGELLVLIGYLQVIGPLVGGVVSYFGGFGTIASGAVGVLTGALTTIGGILTSFPALVAAILGTLTAAFVGLYKKSEDIMELFDAGEFGMAVSMAVGAMITGIIAAVGKLAAILADTLGFKAPWITMFLDAFSPETFDKIMVGIGTSISEGFDSIVDGVSALLPRFVIAAGELGEALIDGFYDFFQISSPSRLMMDMIGGPILDGLMAPFTDFPKLLKDIMLSALEMVPEPIKKMLTGEGGVLETAGDLAGMATDKVAGVFDAVGDAMAGDGAKEPYVLNISLNMDGREIDKKVINVVGGIARDATVGG